MYTRNRIVGSNPTFTARYEKKPRLVGAFSFPGEWLGEKPPGFDRGATRRRNVAVRGDGAASVSGVASWGSGVDLLGPSPVPPADVLPSPHT